ncbi:TonB family protein [Alteromonas marina]|uniref:M56 family metallopeptidase n=1 Tax=unclassified Alteromonas TaxID=2614992 RepID=UPI0012E50D76|nr:M56 family metallopeptidase [Alteromonas sp. KUL150]GFD75827.1 protein TonB [Tenacibaculum sp. KUL113]GFD87184.1 protein TonB [Alteromonas sp. KUL150]|tara:strand:- start:231 stop:1472 length:1242 start_codon:yes stop_codon:yes gene_type:complete
MIDWLIAQQGVLSLALGLLIICEHFFTNKIGVSLSYKLWALVPACLIVNNLPMSLVSIPSSAFTRYVVGVKPTLGADNFATWFTLWAIGVTIITTYVLVHHIATWTSISKRHALHTNAYYSSKAPMPMLFGFIKPKVLIPFSFKSTFSVKQQALVLEHENVHRKHYDHLWNTLALILAILFWFNPLVWLALKSFRINQELACDNAVLKHKTDKEKLTYAKALVQCAEHCSNALHRTMGLYPTFGEKRTMIKRLNAIKQPIQSSKVLAAGMLSIAALLTVNTALANSPVPSAKAENNINMASPVKRVPPAYPEKAAQNNVEGLVVLSFDITETGATDNINVVKSKPAGVFDESAKVALKQWEYKPRIQGGKGVRQTGLLVQLDYQLSASLDTASIEKNALPDAERIIIPPKQSK